jgi:hypothetical protein
LDAERRPELSGRFFIAIALAKPLLRFCVLIQKELAWLHFGAIAYLYEAKIIFYESPVHSGIFPCGCGMFRARCI